MWGKAVLNNLKNDIGGVAGWSVNQDTRARGAYTSARRDISHAEDRLRNEPKECLRRTKLCPAKPLLNVPRAKMCSFSRNVLSSLFLFRICS